MGRKKHKEICTAIAKISPFIRFVGIIGSRGKVLASWRRHGMRPFLNAENTAYQFSHIAIQTNMDATFDKQLGRVEFVWEERKKVQIISFGIGRNRVWLSIDKKVIRTEILRIIDSCLPIVRRHS